ncbi:hypothetical protein Vadar_006012 [Vaccinium darrowii]|uniref:Uncharacterized protein n=1 Tax=Vaccinium darrowii TaxID=229202 RepID=A0ACB7YJM8_9ERIC|nr:hypothetical protein Vadar_006012 [Vaccinium darrowii]
MFVPSSYKAVEDFSDQWWALVHSSPWFQDYWLRERFQDPESDPIFSENDDPAPLLLDLDSLFDVIKQEEEERKYNKDLVSLQTVKWRNARVSAEKPRYAEKAPKIVNVKIGVVKLEMGNRVLRYWVPKASSLD